jgi:carbon storage regulator
MLVLTRHADESLIIGDLVEITVVEIRGNKVRLGITAPKDVSVDRKEVHESKQGKEKKKGDGRR